MNPWDDLRRGCSHPRLTSCACAWITISITLARSEARGLAMPSTSPHQSCWSGTETRFPTKPYVISTGAVFGLTARDIVLA